jgi:hypothetical protein
MCKLRGITREQLLGEYVPTLEYIWPGFLTWLRERDPESEQTGLTHL